MRRQGPPRSRSTDDCIRLFGSSPAGSGSGPASSTPKVGGPNPSRVASPDRGLALDSYVRPAAHPTARGIATHAYGTYITFDHCPNRVGAWRLGRRLAVRDRAGRLWRYSSPDTFQVSRPGRYRGHTIPYIESWRDQWRCLVRPMRCDWRSRSCRSGALLRLPYLAGWPGRRGRTAAGRGTRLGRGDGAMGDRRLPSCLHRRDRDRRCWAVCLAQSRPRPILRMGQCAERQQPDVPRRRCLERAPCGIRSGFPEHSAARREESSRCQFRLEPGCPGSDADPTCHRIPNA